MFFTSGTLEILPDGNGFLRHTVNDYVPNLATDAMVHPGLIEKYSLQSGQIIDGVLAPVEGDDAVLVLHEVLTVFGDDLEK